MLRQPLFLLVLAAWAMTAIAGRAQEPAPAPGFAWEYKVVGLVDRHEKVLSYLKRAVEDGEGLLGVAREVDAELAQKTEDLLNELGADGWELIQVDATGLVLKRPRR